MNLGRPTSIIRIILAAFLVMASAVAQAGIPVVYGEYSMAYQGPETLTLLVTPSGSGDAFDQASLPFGGREDATITLLLMDANYQPIANYPREDIWLVSEDAGLAPCTGGTIADANTDAAGSTRWRNPLFAGGHSQTRTVALVNGATLELTVGVNRSFNSPDINGDRFVNLTDVQIFTYDFYTGFNFQSDFHRDGILNLSDLAVMSYGFGSFGSACP